MFKDMGALSFVSCAPVDGPQLCGVSYRDTKKASTATCITVGSPDTFSFKK